MPNTRGAPTPAKPAASPPKEPPIQRDVPPPPIPPDPPDVPEIPEAPEPLPHDAAISIDDRAHKLNQLYWLRIALAVAAGISATFIFDPYEGEARRWASIGYMIILFAATVFVARAMRIPLPKSDRKKIVTQALPSYIFVYLFVWVLSYTIVNVPASDTALSPFP